MIRTFLIFFFCVASACVTAADFSSWTRLIPGPLPPNLQDICTLEGEIWISEQNHDLALRSRDAQSWSEDAVLAFYDTKTERIRRGGIRFKSLNGEIVATGPNESILRRDKNGVWRLTDPLLRGPSGFFYSINDIEFNGRQWVAVGGHVLQQGGHSIILLSKDGESWDAHYNEFPFRLNSVRWTGEKWLVAGGHFEVGGWVLESLDGVRWTPEHVAGHELLDCIPYSGGLIAAFGTIDSLAGGVAHKGVDNKWTTVLSRYNGPENLYTHGRLNKFEEFNGFAYVAGRDGVFRSKDGINWYQSLKLQGHGEFKNLRAIADALYAVGTPGLLFRTTDGESWEDLNNTHRPLRHWSSVPRYLLPSWNGINALGSDDGRTWAMYPVPFGEISLRAVSKVKGGFLAIGYSGTVYSLSDSGEHSVVFAPLSRFGGVSGLFEISGRLYGAIEPHYTYGTLTSGYIEIDLSEGFPPKVKHTPTSSILSFLAGLGGRLLGANDKTVYEIDPATGNPKAIFSVPDRERITALASTGKRAILATEGYPSNYCRWSENSQDWSHPVAIPARFRSIDTIGNHIRATDGKDVWLSLDGETWTEELSTYNESLSFSRQSDRLFAYSGTENTVYSKVDQAPVVDGIGNVSVLVYLRARKTAIVGLVPRSGNSEVLARAVTNELKSFGVSNHLEGGVTLRLYNASAMAVSGRRAGESQTDYTERIRRRSSDVGAFPAPALRGGVDSELFDVSDRAYTLCVSNESDRDGYVLIESYCPGLLANASIRLRLSPNVPRPIFGMNAPGGDPKGFLFRMVSDGLTPFGVSEVANGMRMRLFNSESSSAGLIAARPKNAVTTDAEQVAGAFDTGTSRETIRELRPVQAGAYTIMLEADSEGEALFEAYLIEAKILD